MKHIRLRANPTHNAYCSICARRIPKNEEIWFNDSRSWPACGPGSPLDHGPRLEVWIEAIEQSLKEKRAVAPLTVYPGQRDPKPWPSQIVAERTENEKKLGDAKVTSLKKHVQPSLF
jgi:hypothetical protein